MTDDSKATPPADAMERAREVTREAGITESEEWLSADLRLQHSIAAALVAAEQAARAEIGQRLWNAYGVYSSNGATRAVFDRHIWPIIKELRALAAPTERKEPT